MLVSWSSFTFETVSGTNKSQFILFFLIFFHFNVSERPPQTQRFCLALAWSSISIDNLETASGPDIAVVARPVVKDPFQGNVILVGSNIAVIT